MPWYFFPFPSNTPFIQWGTAHVAMVLLLTAACVAFFIWKPTQTARRRFRYGLALVLLVNELSWHLWHAGFGLWTVQEMLPLEVCNLMVLLAAWELISLNRHGFPFLYLLGIAGAMQVLITPGLGPYGFPHILFFQIFISHGGVILAAIYLATVEGLRLEGWRDVIRVGVVTNFYALFIMGVNAVLGSNFLFLAEKPPVPTVLDYLGPWPWYILGMEVIGVVLFVLLALPFIFRKGRGNLAKL